MLAMLENNTEKRLYIKFLNHNIVYDKIKRRFTCDCQAVAIWNQPTCWHIKECIKQIKEIPDEMKEALET